VILFIINRNPYDGTDVTWNALRLAEQMLALGVQTNIFLMNDAVDLARDAARPPEGYFDLGEMLKELIGYKGQPYFDGAQEAKITELAQWVKEAENIVSF